MAKPAAKTGKPAAGKKDNGAAKKFTKPAGVSKPRAGAGGAPKQHGKGKAGGGAPKGNYKQQGKPEQVKAPAPAEKLSKKDQKIAKRAKFSALKKNFNIIQDAAHLWELLRPRNTAPEQRQQLVDQIIGKVHGKVLELAQHHTASRIIQFCIKYGSREQQASVMAEVRASIVELSKSKHGHYLVCKLITAAKKEEVSGLLAQFKGHVAELLRHPRGSDVLVDLYDIASTEQRNVMCAEFYGMEFVLFDGVGVRAGGLTGLKQLLEGVNTAKKRAVFQHMTRALMPVMEKAILHPPMVHRLVREFLECAPSMSVEDVVDTLTQAGTNVLKMVHTHDGAAAVCMLIAYGNAKDRKRLVKSMKGHVHDMAVNEWGHAALCTLLSVVDDTNMLIKALGPELKALVGEGLEDQHAHRVIMQLLSPDNRRYLPQAVLEMMHPAQRTVVGSSGKMVTDLEGDEDEVDVHATFADDSGAQDGDDGEDLFAQPSTSKKEKAGKKGAKSKGKDDEGEDGDGQKGGKASAKAGSDDEAEEEAKPSGPRTLGLSKKDPVLRRKELLGKGANSMSGLLTSLVAEQAGALLRSPHGCDVVVEVARGGDGGVLAELCPEGVAKVQEAVAACLRGGDEGEAQAGPAGPSMDDEAGAGPAMEHVVVHYYGSRALRRLVLSSAEEEEARKSQAAVACVELLWRTALQGRCKDWVGGHGDKVLAALLHCGSEEVRAAAAKELQPLLKGKDLAQWSEPLVKPPQGKVEKQQGKGKQQKQSKEAEAPQQKQQQKQQVQSQGAKGQGQAAAGKAAGAKRPAAEQGQKPAKKQAGKGKK